MKLSILEEPELEFGGKGRHIDIRFGIRDYGPFDLGSPRSPQQIQIGLIGTTETTEAASMWLEKCKLGIERKESRQPNLFPAFPPVSLSSSFCCLFETSRALTRNIPANAISNLAEVADMNTRIEAAAQIVLREIEVLCDNAKPDVIVCALPLELLEVLFEERRSPGRMDLHHLLKARSMQFRTPIQLILPGTYDESKAKKQKRAGTPRPLQDEATRAWNFFSALYYKAGGTPWRLERDPYQLAACFVGISFFETLDQSRLTTSMAQVFNELGEGVVVRGGPAALSKEDRQPHLGKEDCEQLLKNALARYREIHKTLPARVVVHKSSPFTVEELAGASSAIHGAGVDIYDLLHITNSDIRLYRDGVYPPLRGTLLQTSSKAFCLYTKGSVPFFETYPGLYVPRPIEVTVAAGEGTPLSIAKEVLALTKMNWNSTQFDGSMPLTITAAAGVGKVLKHCSEGQRAEPRYSFYM